MQPIAVFANIATHAISRHYRMHGVIVINAVIYGSNGMDNLPLEKQMTHAVFCKQIQNIDIDSAKQLLIELHLLYLSQQSIFVKLAKGERKC
jgi:hypothetical protein